MYDKLLNESQRRCVFIQLFNLNRVILFYLTTEHSSRLLLTYLPQYVVLPLHIYYITILFTHPAGYVNSW